MNRPTKFISVCGVSCIPSVVPLSLPSQGEVQPPLVVMHHPSYDSSGPRFVLHLDKKRQHAGDSAVDVVTAETDERLFLPAYIHVLTPGAGELGDGAVFVLFCAHSPRKESVHGNKVTTPALVSP